MKNFNFTGIAINFLLKNKAVLFLFIFCSFPIFSQESVEIITIHTSDQSIQPMKMFVGVLGDKSDACQKLIADFKRCCQWSGRFELTVTWLDTMPKKRSSVQKLFDQEYDCAVFITYKGFSQPIEWRLYDTAAGLMLQGRKLLTEETKKTAYLLATYVLQELTSEPQPFQSKIVYRKKEKKGRIGFGACSLVVTDFDGTDGHTILRSPQRIIVCPRWTHDKKNPAIIFSEFTPSNVRLKMCDLVGNSLVVFDFEGTTMGVSFAASSDQVVYCRSGDIWSYVFDKTDKTAVHTCIIHDEKIGASGTGASGICSHPTLLDSGDIIYGCQGSLKKYNAATKKSESLNVAGFCIAPAYSTISHKVAYTKKINGQMQLYLYDMATQKDQQVTFASSKVDDKDYRSDKTDPFWAPDGVHVVFCWERQDKSRIAILNTLTKKYSFITSESEYCSYPAWSHSFF